MCSSIAIRASVTLALISSEARALSLALLCESDALLPDLLRSLDKLRDTQTHPVLRELFITVPQQLVKKPSSHAFVVHEFDSYTDYEQFFIRFKEDLTNTLRLIATVRPLLAVEWTLEFVCQVSATPTPEEPARLGDWESAALVLDCVCNKVPESGEVSSPSVKSS